MHPDALEQNSRTLAALLGQSEHDSLRLLARPVRIRVGPDPSSQRIAEDARLLLERTFLDVGQEPVPGAIELIVGLAHSSCGPSVYILGDKGRVVITAEPSNCSGGPLPGSLDPALCLLTACYAAAHVTRQAVVSQGIPLPRHRPIVLDPSLLAMHHPSYTKPIDIGETHLAGAGAIGNAFLAMLCRFRVTGRLHIVDGDVVDGGNLNRCWFFRPIDIGANKAERLRDLIAPSVPELDVLGHPVFLHDLEGRRGRWLRRLVVAVDSRRARRRLQTELPHQVFDASTTGIHEIVLHFNTQPSEAACLSCIYYRDREEGTREHHVARALGVSIEEVQELLVSATAAQKIARHAGLDPTAVEGLAYDSLFRALCGSGRLPEAAADPMLAPFAFVSVLAGAWLGLEFVRRVHARAPQDDQFNYWRLSPWSPPNPSLRQLRPRRPKCEFCGTPALRDVAEQLWRC